MDPMGDVSSIHKTYRNPQHEVVSLSSLSRDTEMESPRVSQPRSRSRSHTPQYLGLFKQNAETTSGGDDFKGLILKCDD